MDNSITKKYSQTMKHNNINVFTQGKSTISTNMRTTLSLISTHHMITSPSCTTDPCPSTRMRASPPSPPPSLTLMRSLARGWTSVLLTSSGLTACMTVVGITEVLYMPSHVLRMTFHNIVFSSQHTHSAGPVLIWTDQHLWNDPERWRQLRLGPDTEHSRWYGSDTGGALQR